MTYHPFNDLNSLLPLTHETQEFDSVIALPKEYNGRRCGSSDDESSNDNSEWECDKRSAFEAFVVDE